MVDHKLRMNSLILCTVGSLEQQPLEQHHSGDNPFCCRNHEGCRSLLFHAGRRGLGIQ